MAGLAETWRGLTVRSLSGGALAGKVAGTLRDTLEASLGANLASALGASVPGRPGAPVQGAPGRLVPMAVSPNPGALRMWLHLPAGLRPGAPLVVALHGCTQTAAGFDTGAGWSELADREGFALLCPEQVQGNNANTCFNWFEPGDTVRGAGEVASVAAAVAHAVREHRLDARRVFVTGLSAGGAMAAALLACYPDVFAAGAVVAGLPFGVAHDVQGAMQAMFRGPSTPAATLGDKVRAAAPAGFAGPFPRVSVWHGTADRTVKPVNAAESVAQWRNVHGTAGAGEVDGVGGTSRTVWRDRAGRVVVEQVMVPALGHGVPVAPGLGVVGPYMLAATVSSTQEIARFFGLLPAEPGRAA